MRDLAFYIEAAKSHSQLHTDKDLDRALGFKGAGVSQWRTGRSWPSEENMTRLAELGNLNPVQAITDLGQWRGPESVRAIYARIAEKLGTAAAVLGVLTLGGCGAQHVLQGIQEIGCRLPGEDRKGCEIWDEKQERERERAKEQEQKSDAPRSIQVVNVRALLPAKFGASNLSEVYIMRHLRRLAAAVAAFIVPDPRRALA